MVLYLQHLIFRYYNINLFLSKFCTISVHVLINASNQNFDTLLSCRVVGQLEEQLKNVRSQLADHVTQLGVANKMVTVLQEQLIVSRQEQAEMKSELVQLKEENSLLHESLRNTQQVSL